MQNKESFSKVEVLRCDHCLEHYTLDEESMQEHLKECKMNPDNKSCIRCKNLLLVMDMQNSKPDTRYYCKKLEKELMQEDILLLNAECYEYRENKQIEQKNGKEYGEYLHKLAKKIHKSMKQ